MNKYRDEISKFNTIIGVGRGGSYTYDFLRRNFNQQKFGYLVAKREKKYNQFSKFNLLKLSYSFLEHRSSPVSVEIKSMPKINTKEKILLIDDKITTGKTIQAVIDYLVVHYNIHRENIFTLCLIDPTHESYIYLSYENTNHIFPWSSISKEYSTFLTWYENNMYDQLVA